MFSFKRHYPRLIVLASALLFVVSAPVDHARADDRVERLARQMLRADDDRVRLSAAINLARTGDPRAVRYFARALRDSDESVRGVAATALGRLTDEDSAMDRRRSVVRVLRPVAQDDPEEFVRDRAERSIRRIRSLPEPAADEPDVYVDVGAMSDNTGGGGDLRQVLRDTVSDAVDSGHGAMGSAWPGGNPSASDLEDAGARAFHVDGTITSLTTRDAGRGAQVACEVSMVIATYPEKSMFGFLDGGGQVQAGSSDAQVERAQRDCVVAVAENLVSSRVIPTIEQRAQ